MAAKNIKELVQAENILDDDLMLVETDDGTRSIPYSKIKSKDKVIFYNTYEEYENDLNDGKISNNTLICIGENVLNNGNNSNGNGIKWSDIEDAPTIPTKTSQLENDSSFKTTDNDTWKACTADSEGYVSKGSGNPQKVWKTNGYGIPAWRDESITRIKLGSDIVYGTGDFHITPQSIGAIYDGFSSGELYYCTINQSEFYNLLNEPGGGITHGIDTNMIMCNNGSLKVVKKKGISSLGLVETQYSDVTASSFNTSSSRRVKENITDMTEEEARKILDVDVVGYDYINGNKDQYGMIAEDVAKIIPNIVSGDVNCDDADLEAINSIGIDYSKAVPYLIKIVQMQEKKLKKLNEKIEAS